MPIKGACWGLHNIPMASYSMTAMLYHSLLVLDRKVQGQWGEKYRSVADPGFGRGKFCGTVQVYLAVALFFQH